MATKKQLSFDIWQHPSVARTSAYALIFDGSPCGRIIIGFPADGMGNAKCLIAAWDGPFRGMDAMLGQAGGCGHDKSSAAIDDALDRAGVEHPDLHGRGMSAVETWLQSIGYALFSVC